MRHRAQTPLPSGTQGGRRAGRAGQRAERPDGEVAQRGRVDELVVRQVAARRGRVHHAELLQRHGQLVLRAGGARGSVRARR